MGGRDWIRAGVGGRVGRDGDGVVVQECRNGGIEVPVVAFEEEEGFLFGGGGDLAEGVDYGVVLGIGFLSFSFHGVPLLIGFFDCSPRLRSAECDVGEKAFVLYVLYLFLVSLYE